MRKKYHKDDLVPVVPAYASQSLCDLLLRLLKKNPKERMTFSECACGVLVSYRGKGRTEVKRREH